MEKPKRRSFTEDYKRQATELVASSGRSIGSVAAELGLAETVLRKWVNKFSVSGQPSHAGGASDADSHAQRARQRVAGQADVLKAVIGEVPALMT